MALQFVTQQFKDSSITEDKVADSAISNDKLAGSIADSKLLTISTSNKVSGSAVQLAGSGGLSDSSGLQISAGGVTDAMLAGSISFSKLADSANIARLDQAETVAAVWAFGSNLPTASADPSNDNQLARKAYVDSVSQGLDVKESCQCASTANLTLSGTQTIDGFAATAGDRVLVKDQSTGTENGIYVVAAGAWSRAEDFAAGDSEAGAFTFIENGTANDNSGFVCSNAKGSDVVGTDALTFSQFSGAGQITAGNGLAKTGNTLSVNVDDSSLEINGDALRVKADGISQSMIADDAVGADQLASSAVVTASIVDDAVTTAKIADDAVTAAKLASNAVVNASIANGAAIAVDKLENMTAGRILMGDASNIPTITAISGDIALSNSGVASISAGVIVNADVSASAAIDFSKLAALASAKLLVGNGSNVATAVSISGDVTMSNAGVVTIANDAVEQAMIADDAVGADQLASSAVVTASIVDLNVTTAKLAADAVTAAKLADNAVVEAAIVDGAVSTDKLADDAVILEKLAITPKYEEVTASSTGSYNLGTRILDASFRVAGNIRAYLNGQRLSYSASPSSYDQYSISDNGSATTITFGANLPDGSLLQVEYMC